MIKHEGNNPGQRNRDRDKAARQFQHFRILMVAIAALIGALLGVLGRRYGLY